MLARSARIIRSWLLRSLSHTTHTAGRSLCDRPRTRIVHHGLCLFLTLVAASARVHGATTWFVDASIPNGFSNSGLGWAAPKSLEDALALAVTGDEIRLREGTYVPSINHIAGSTDPRDQSFLINKGITLIGGWLGTEGTSTAPRGCPNKTILSGELGVPGQGCDNTYHVVSILNATGLKIGLHRLEVAAGKAALFAGGYPCPTPQFYGSIAPSRMLGAGVHINTRATVQMSEVILYDNSCNGLGSGIYCNKAFLTIRQSLFEKNVAHNWDLGGGAGIYCTNATAKFHSVVFDTNTDSARGGGAYVSNGDYEFVNCAFQGNTAAQGSGGAAFVEGDSSALFFNCSFGNNVASTPSMSAQSLAYTIDCSSLTGECRLFNCVVNNNFVAIGPVHFVVPVSSTAVLEAQASYLEIRTGDPSPSLVPSPGGRFNVLWPTSISFAPGNLSLAPFTTSSVTAGGDLLLLPSDVLDLDGDGDSSESIPVDRERRSRLTVPIGGGSQLSMGAYEGDYSPSSSFPGIVDNQALAAGSAGCGP